MSTRNPTPQDPHNHQPRDGAAQQPGQEPHGSPDQPDGAQEREQPRYGQYSQPQPPQPQYGQYSQPQPPQPQYGQYSQPQPPQPQYGQPQYGQQPQPGPYSQGQGYGYPGLPLPAQKGPAPREVEWGFRLILASGVLFLIANIASSFGLSSALTAQDRQMLQDSGMDMSTFDSMLTTFSIVLSVLVFGLYLLVALFVRKGRNWARILGTVFAAFSFVNLLVSFTGYFGSFMGIVSLVSILLGIAGIVMLYLKPSVPYFQAPNPYRY